MLITNSWIYENVHFYTPLSLPKICKKLNVQHQKTTKRFVTSRLFATFALHEHLKS